MPLAVSVACSVKLLPADSAGAKVARVWPVNRSRILPEVGAMPSASPVPEISLLPGSSGISTLANAIPSLA